MEKFRQYWTSRSGYVRPREGAGLGVVVVALVAMGLIVSAVTPTYAANWDGCCAQLDPGQSKWCCSDNPYDYCDYPYFTVIWKYHVMKQGSGQCSLLEQFCGCT